MLEEALSNGRLHHGQVADRLSQKLLPADLVESVRQRSADILTKAGINSDQAQKVLLELSSSRVLMQNRFSLPQLRNAAVHIVGRVEDGVIRYEVCVEPKGSRAPVAVIAANTPEEAGVAKAAIEAFIAKMLTLPEKMKPPLKPRKKQRQRLD